MATYRGVVMKGDGAAGRLGFPSANITITGDESLSGIFAARVTLADGSTHPAAVYADRSRKLLEAHLLDFSGDLYGQEIEIELHEKIRDDKTFTHEDDLKKAIAADVATVRRSITQSTSTS